MRAAPLLLFASAFAIAGLSAALDGPDLSLEPAAPALAEPSLDCRDGPGPRADRELQSEAGRDCLPASRVD